MNACQWIVELKSLSVVHNFTKISKLSRALGYRALLKQYDISFLSEEIAVFGSSDKDFYSNCDKWLEGHVNLGKTEGVLKAAKKQKTEYFLFSPHTDSALPIAGFHLSPLGGLLSFGFWIAQTEATLAIEAKAGSRST